MSVLLLERVNDVKLFKNTQKEKIPYWGTEILLEINYDDGRSKL